MTKNMTLSSNDQDMHFDRIFYQKGWMFVFTDNSTDMEHICFTALFHLLRMFPDGSDSSKCKWFAQAIIRGSISLLLLPITVILGIICLLFSFAKSVCFELVRLFLKFKKTIVNIFSGNYCDFLNFPILIAHFYSNIILIAFLDAIFIVQRMFRFHVNVGLKVDSSVIFTKYSCEALQRKINEKVKRRFVRS